MSVAYDGHFRIGVVLEDVEVVKPVGVSVGVVATAGLLETQRRGVLRNTVNVLIAGEGNVEAE